MRAPTVVLRPLPRVVRNAVVLRWLPMIALAVIAVGCDAAGGLGGAGGGTGTVQVANCTLDIDLFRDGGVGKDGIPALTSPRLIGAGDVTYLNENSRVIGVVWNGQALAVPHEILWYHEIVNVSMDGKPLAITYCPLTGSSIVFDRDAVQGAALGVSGLLFKSNLTMYDRNTNESLWPQMMREAGCGDRVGAVLPVVASQEMTWASWRGAHPDTKVLSAQTGSGIPYSPELYPYQDYERLDAPPFVPVDYERLRSPKERVLGIFDGLGGIAFPYLALDSTATPARAVNSEARGEPVVIFWSRTAQAAVAYSPVVDGNALSFTAEGEGFVDAETGTLWRFDGTAFDGPLAGAALEPVPEAYTAFWFAWSAFHPATELWQHATGGS